MGTIKGDSGFVPPCAPSIEDARHGGLRYNRGIERGRLTDLVLDAAKSLSHGTLLTLEIRSKR